MGGRFLESGAARFAAAGAIVVALCAHAQPAPEGLRPLRPDAVRGPNDTKLQTQERSAEIGRQKTATPIEIQTFLRQFVGAKDDEVVEESEIDDLLNRFEFQYRLLIPDRDVLASSQLTAKQLVQALQARVERTPDGDGNLPPAAIRINGASKSNWEALKPFQRRDMLNNPRQMLAGALSPPGLRGGAGDFYNSNGALNSAQRAGFPRVSAEDVVGRAMLDVRPDIGDPAQGDALARIRASNRPLSSADYNLIKARFLQMPSERAYKALGLPERDLAGRTSASDRFDDDWFKLRIAVFRRYQEKSTQSYSNGRPRFDPQGRELHPNGRPKFDESGRPLYANGRRKFDDAGRPMHSNGVPQFNSAGTRLYANGRPQKADSGVGLFRSGGKNVNERGVPLYDNGRPRIAQDSSQGSVRERLPGQNAAAGAVAQIGVPVSPDGRRQLADDGRALYEDGRPVVSDAGVPLYKNQQKRLAPNGLKQFDNARDMDNARGEALTYDSAAIAGTFGFQGRPDGVFPLAFIEPAAWIKADGPRAYVRLERGRQEAEFSLERAFVGSANEAAPLADAKKIPPSSRVRVVWFEPTRFVDGRNVGPAGDATLVALFTTSPSAVVQSDPGEIPVVQLFHGVVSSVSENVLTLQDREAGVMREIQFDSAAVQRTRAGRLEPIPPAALAPGRPATVVASTSVRLGTGRSDDASPTAIAVWQDGP